MDLLEDHLNNQRGQLVELYPSTDRDFAAEDHLTSQALQSADGFCGTDVLDEAKDLADAADKDFREASQETAEAPGGNYN